MPEALHSLKTLCRRYFHCEPLVVGEPSVDVGVAVKVDAPDEVGADRLVNAASAHARYGGPLIVIDFGTATTFDVVDADGAYAGGVIAPGINLSLDALHQAAAKLPRIAVERPDHVIGKRTIPAMRSGIFWGYVGLIEGVVARIREEYGEPMKVIATGGLAPLFADATAADRASRRRPHAARPCPDQRAKPQAHDACPPRTMPATTKSCSCRSGAPARSA